MRVAQLVDSLRVGGAERLQVTFAEAARERGIEVTVISLGSDESSPIPVQLQALGARVVRFPAGSLLNPRRIFSLTRFLHRERFDVVQTHLTYANVIGAICGRLARLPVVATLHSTVLDPADGQVALRLEAALLRSLPQRVVAVGHTVAAFHRPRLGGRELRVIPNAVRELPPLAAPERLALRQELVGDATRPLLVSVGRLSPLKGYPDLLAAFALLRERHPSAALVIAGGGEQQAELAGLVEARGLAGHAFLLGQRDDVPRLLRAGDLYASASHIEGLPLAILEAMAAGLPIVATSVGDVGHILVSGTGMVVPPRDPAALAEAIGALLDEPSRASALGTAAQARVSRCYSPAAWLQQLLTTYAELMPAIDSCFLD